MWDLWWTDRHWGRLYRILWFLHSQLAAKFWCQRLWIEGCSVVDAPDPPWPLISVFYTGAAILSFKLLLIYLHEVEWSPIQTHWYSENLLAPGIEPGPLGLQTGALTTRPQRRSEDTNEVTKLECTKTSP
jgi:hypothetical protein